MKLAAMIVAYLVAGICFVVKLCKAAAAGDQSENR
jgi:hypothetical protein